MSSIKEVAKAAGVSVTTVSYVLNGKGNISPETRRRVLKVIEDMKFTPSIQARNLRDRQSRIVGYAWRAPLKLRDGNPVLDSFLHEVILRLEAHGLHTLIFNDPFEESIAVYQDLIQSKRVDGFIIVNTEEGDERLSYLHEQGFPFVSFGRSATELDSLTAWVDVDGHAGIYAATCHLAEQGHERIGLLCWPAKSVAGDARYQGYIDALNACGLPVDMSLIRRGRNLVNSAYECTVDLMSLPHRPTAIVALSDIMAIGALRCCAEYGYPLAVTGFDDIPTAEYMSPPLTTLRQPVEEVARLLVGMLLSQLADEPLPEKQHLLAPELVVRASSLVDVSTR